jgi:hypothetical protein
MNLPSIWSFHRNSALSETDGRADQESEASLPSHQYVLFDEKHRTKLFHGVTQHIESMVHRPSAERIDKETETVTACEVEINTRKQQFGIDAFHIMNQNREAGGSTGGEVEPLLVEIFADAVTDIIFLIEKQQHKQDHPVNVGKFGLTFSADNGDGDESAGNSCMRNSPHYCEQQAWGPRLTRWMGLKTSQQDNEVNKLRSELNDMSQAIRNRKRAFGVEVYDAIVSLGESFRPNDCELGDTFDATKRDIQDLTDRIKEAKTALEKCGSSVSHDELRDFVHNHPQFWAMLSVNCQLPEEKCQEITFRVALEFVTGCSGDCALDATMTKSCFQHFQRYLKEPKGQQEFFHRSVFMAFDDDWNGVLDGVETDKFLDTYYRSGSIFEGDKRLPSQKEDLKKMILKQKQVNVEQTGDNDIFTYQEIRSLISGLGLRESPHMDV